MTRRVFMGAGLMAGISAAGQAMPWRDQAPEDVVIERVECWPILYPTVMRFKFFEGPASGSGRPAVIIRITASDGTIGWGESVPVPRWSYETLEAAVSTIEQYIAPIITGMNPFDIAAIHAAMNREIANGFTTGMPITKAGIDIALHDLIGRRLGKNISALWGRETSGRLTLSWTLNPKTLDDLEPLIEQGRQRGFEHFNVKVAPDPAFDLEMCRIVKQHVPDGFLWCDANGGYDLETALAAAPKLADVGVPVLEQPIPINNITGYQALKKQGALPITVDEGMISPVELEQYIELGCCDGVAMKPARCGGLLSARAQIELVQARNRMFLGSGLTDPDISLAASLILYSAYGLKYPAALNGPQFLGESVIAEPFVPEGGSVRVPSGPGLGIEVDEEKLAGLAAS